MSLPSTFWQGKQVILGVTGGIAAYKAATICSQLSQAGAIVNVILSAGAKKFITPLTFQTLSRQPVYTDTFEEFEPQVVSHIALADRADLVLIAPATANCIAKLAHGIADDMLTTTLLATRAPLFIAPAMNVHMYAHDATQQNMQLLAARGVTFIEPGVGQLACGYVGQGRLAEPHEIVTFIEHRLSKALLLSGKRVLITAGGTIERLDPVRYLTNDSSGRMGFALAAAARDLGAQVTVVAARTTVSEPAGVDVIRAYSAAEMFETVMVRASEFDLIVKAAAVADYRPVQQAKTKLKKDSTATLHVELERTQDILAELGRQKRPGQLLVGFAAETNDVAAYAQQKLKSKGCDLIVANDVAADGSGFNVPTNAVDVYDVNGLVGHWEQDQKEVIALRLMELFGARLR